VFLFFYTSYIDCYIVLGGMERKEKGGRKLETPPPSVPAYAPESGNKEPEKTQNAESIKYIFDHSVESEKNMRLVDIP